MASELIFSQFHADQIEPHLPPITSAAVSSDTDASTTPFVTLTFATSLDSALALAPGTRTALSGPESKAMTHYLRSRHDAICVGVGTAIADDPGLNCRIAGVGAAGQPRPIVIDPWLRWGFTRESKVMQLAKVGQGRAPFILTARDDLPAAQKTILEEVGGKYITIQSTISPNERFQWKDILAAVGAEGLHSIMIEGGGEVINSLLDSQSADLVDSVIVTIAPTWLGRGSVQVYPPRRTGPDGQPIPAARLAKPFWIPLGDDVVLCGKISKSA